MISPWGMRRKGIGFADRPVGACDASPSRSHGRLGIEAAVRCKTAQWCSRAGGPAQVGAIGRSVERDHLCGFSGGSAAGLFTGPRPCALAGVGWGKQRTCTCKRDQPLNRKNPSALRSSSRVLCVCPCAGGAPGTGTWMDEVTKKSAPNTATRGISSSRIPQAPHTINSAATTKPPAHHSGRSMSWPMWTLTHRATSSLALAHSPFHQQSGTPVRKHGACRG